MSQSLASLETHIKYDQLIQLWREFCSAHTALYDLTCEEYLDLLNSDIDKLEYTLKKKQKILDSISFLERKRQEVINEINEKNLLGSRVENVADLLEKLQHHEVEKKGSHLLRFNELLVSIITKIQAQNKKNQIFLNRAMLNLKEMKEAFVGKKSYSTYNASGASK
jgi:flagellar biosynthesis/type III secretory pathway chaperone